MTARVVCLVIVVGAVGAVVRAEQAVETARVASVELHRGDHVRVKAPHQPSAPPASDFVLTIVAVPQDHVRVTESRVYVNDVALSGFSSELLERIAQSSHTPHIVPEEQYLVIGELRRTPDDVSNYWGVIEKADLEVAE